MAAALARVVGGGAAARLSLAEMMGVRGARVAPRGLGGRRRPGRRLWTARRLRRKTRLALELTINFTARLAEIATSRVIVGRKRCIPSSVTTRTGACSRSAREKQATPATPRL